MCDSKRQLLLKETLLLELEKESSDFDRFCAVMSIWEDYSKVLNGLSADLLEAKAKELIQTTNKYTCQFCEIQNITTANTEKDSVELVCANCGTYVGTIRPFFPEWFIAKNKEREENNG